MRRSLTEFHEWRHGWLTEPVGCSRCHLNDEKTTKLQHLPDSMSATVLYNGSETEPFKVETCVKHGCVNVATLFTVFSAVILHLVGHSLPPSIQIIYGTDSKLLHLNRFRAKAMICHTFSIELPRADDKVIITHIEKIFSTHRMLLPGHTHSLAWTRT